MTRQRAAFLSIGLAALLLASRAAPVRAENIDPANDDHQYAWGENVGWVNAEPSGDGGQGAVVGDFALTGWMWGENIGWISLSCANTATCGSNDFAVANDGYGALSGFAWAENAGWINFAPTTCLADPTCGVQIDPATGYFLGRAWGENIGFVSFSSSLAPDSWSARTDWCQTTAAAPGNGFTLRLEKIAGNPRLSWSPLAAASWYDGVSGRLSILRSSGGNFAGATDQCVASKLAATQQPVAGSPPAGDGFWYLVRGANCKGRGTYDTGAPSQSGVRDAEIAASGDDCP